MNERIKELMTEASTIRYSGFGDTEILDPEKFAELLIKECMEVCLDQRDPSNLNYKPSVKFAEAIKSHFGVK